MNQDPISFITGEMAKLRSSLQMMETSASHLALLEEITGTVVRALRSGAKIMFCGNGGSAADCQHLAAELVGRQNYDRAAAAGVALTVDTSCLTAIGNDYGYETVFSRQVKALGRPGDVLFGLSTSGRSPNVVRALEAAKEGGITTIAFTGSDPNAMSAADLVLCVPATETAKIQELHIVCGHIIFAMAERILFPKPS